MKPGELDPMVGVLGVDAGVAGGPEFVEMPDLGICKIVRGPHAGPKELLPKPLVQDVCLRFPVALDTPFSFIFIFSFLFLFFDLVN